MKFVAWLVVGDDAAEERAEARDWEDQRGGGARRTKAQRGGNGGALDRRAGGAKARGAAAEEWRGKDAQRGRRRPRS